MGDAPDYDPESPAAWDIRINRGAQLLDRALLTHSWRDTLHRLDYRAELIDFGTDILDLLCAEGHPAACWDAMALYVRQDGTQLADVGFDYNGRAERDEVARAWVRYLDADAAAQEAVTGAEAQL